MLLRRAALAARRSPRRLSTAPAADKAPAAPEKVVPGSNLAGAGATATSMASVNGSDGGDAISNMDSGAEPSALPSTSGNAVGTMPEANNSVAAAPAAAATTTALSASGGIGVVAGSAPISMLPDMGAAATPPPKPPKKALALDDDAAAACHRVRRHAGLRGGQDW